MTSNDIIGFIIIAIFVLIIYLRLTNQNLKDLIETIKDIIETLRI